MQTSDAIVVIGVGQSLRGDDAAGPAVVQLWADQYPESASHPAVRIELAGLPGLGLLDLIYDTREVVIVDALHADLAPGTLVILSETDLETFGAGSATAHGFGVAETLALGRSLEPERMPSQITLIGIQVATMDLGAGLSPPVQDALPGAARLLQEQVVRWLGSISQP